MLTIPPTKQPGAVPGLYLLNIQLTKPIILTPGRLGRQTFEPGNYLYVGSARGSGGLRARLTRHQRCCCSNVRHWHIDHLLKVGSLLNCWWSADDGEQECTWANILSCSGKRWPRGFGASDCRCAGHLVYFHNRNSLRDSIQELTARLNEMYFSSWGPAADLTYKVEQELQSLKPQSS